MNGGLGKSGVELSQPIDAIARVGFLSAQVIAAKSYWQLYPTFATDGSISSLTL
ncbi:hypothetical protein [Oscillatoria sp. FACHB-1406]|uniref:hypothetical protein n=1 Tax=Oscillatoria sp. FACHB-1406 TaxID=2692846 RepID=UPI001688BEF0|nr:hypothetical protein [Oscillatoria sp. FACHB-1406]MBD2578080.1 hypothetical protein [Oscillatoria sp. FACHB-1406]